jgi:putative heme transporter
VTGQAHGREQLIRVGRYAWAALGIVAAAVVVGIVAGQISVVVIPVVLALFPAALLSPLSDWLERVGAPAAVAALATILGLFLALALLIAVLVPVVAAQLPDLLDSLGEGLDELGGLLSALPFLDVEGIDDVLDQVVQALGEAEGLAGGALETAAMVTEGVIGIILTIVVLFFYLKDGRRIAAGLHDTLPERARPHAERLGGQAWSTLGSYFRGQLLVALVDAIFIGIGLLILGIPLAIPLAVLVFFGGLFPIVGAVLTGAVAVLVALAHGGLVLGLLVLGLVVAVQQLESNVLEPLILSRAIALHPLVVLLSITTGAALLGILGAFLAVPVAAVIGRSLDYVRGLEPGGQPAG